MKFSLTKSEAESLIADYVKTLGIQTLDIDVSIEGEFIYNPTFAQSVPDVAKIKIPIIKFARQLASDIASDKVKLVNSIEGNKVLSLADAKLYVENHFKI